MLAVFSCIVQLAVCQLSVPATIESTSSGGILLSVPTGAKVAVQYLDPSTGNPAGEPSELASKADLDALVARVLALEVTKINAETVAEKYLPRSEAAA
eukprot:gene32085-34912_t